MKGGILLYWPLGSCGKLLLGYIFFLSLAISFVTRAPVPPVKQTLVMEFSSLYMAKVGRFLTVQGPNQSPTDRHTEASNILLERNSNGEKLKFSNTCTPQFKFHRSNVLCEVYNEFQHMHSPLDTEWHILTANMFSSVT